MYNPRKVLFILKQKERPSNDQTSETYSEEYNPKGMTTGLLNSASYVSEMLDDGLRIESKIVIVADNNDIDREVFKYKPDIVIIEALWVVPSKLELLTRYHPSVKWVVRLHSELPFIANEGIAFDWIPQYFTIRNTYVAVNSLRMENELEFYYNTVVDVNNIEKKIIYLPNYYPNKFNPKEFDTTKDSVEIACFGAIRPLKNHLIQAMAAVMFGQKVGKKINFHINVSRVEQKGEAVLKNLENFFQSVSSRGHKLIKHGWYEKEAFLVECATMDIGMQCSLSETFNLVTADLISQGVPVVTSQEIQWVDKSSHVDPTDSRSITNTLLAIYQDPKKNAIVNKRYLKKFSEEAKEIWIDFINIKR